MNKKGGLSLLSGRILSLLAETDMDEIVSIRLERPGGEAVLAYREALYSQLGDGDAGFLILEIREIRLAELMGGGHGEMWRRYQRERQDETGGALMATDRHAARRLFLHRVEEKGECLVVAMGWELLPP